MRWCANLWPGGTIGRHSLSQPFGLPAPSEREPGWLSPFTRLLAKIQRYGRFSSPLRNSEILTRYHSSKYTPSVSHSLDSSLREGAGETPPQCQSPARWMFCQRAGDFWGFCVGAGTFYHSTGCLPNRKVTGDFHRPYGTQKVLHFTVQPRRYYSGWAPWNSTWRGSICQWFWVMVSSFLASFSSSPGLRVMHSRVGPAPLRQKAAPVVRTRASMRE